MKPSPLRFTTIIHYSTAMLGGGLVSFFIANYLMKYATDVIFIAPVTVGLVFALSRVWDAVSDPLCGYLSDGTKSRWGRRRSWLLYSIPVLFFSFIFLWATPYIDAFSGRPTGMLGVLRTSWFALWLFVLFTGLTMLYIPHYSLGSELALGQQQRTRIFGIRSIFENIGTVLGVAIVALITEKILGHEYFLWAILGISVFLGLTILPSVLFVKEPVQVFMNKSENVSHKQHFWGSFVTVFKNPATSLVLFVTFLCQLGTTVMLGSVLYFSEYVLQNQALGGRFAAIFLVAATLSVPFWVWMAQRLYFFRPWFIGLSLVTVGFLLLLPAGVWYGDGVTYGITALIGFGAGGILIIQPVALSESIGDDPAATLEPTGMYFAVFTFTNKTAMGIAAFIIGIVLQYSGFKPGAVQGAIPQVAIRLLFTVVPLLCFLTAAILVFRHRGRKSG